MNPAILLYLGQFMQILESLPALIKAGSDVTNIISQGRNAIATMISENRAPTAAEWAVLDTTTDALRAQLHGTAAPGAPAPATTA